MFKHILLPIDLQETQLAEQAVAIALDECRKHNARLTLLTVIHGFIMPIVDDFFPSDVMEQALQEVKQELDRYVADNIPTELNVQTIVDEGKPHEIINLQADKLDVDLIIIPSHTKSINQTVLGSCAAKVVEQANCTVMVVKA